MQLDDVQVCKVLERAAELVVQGWCQFHPAVDAQGRRVLPTEAVAAKWCLTGAIEAAAFQLFGLERADWYNATVQGTLTTRVEKSLAQRGIALGCEVLWNNAPRRRADDVASVLRDAAQ